MLWQTPTRTFDLAARGLVMGILNVTPDSFSDAGQFHAVERAVAHGREMIAAGAELIDIGGESTRPGAAPVPVEEELRRVLPVIEQLAAEGGAVISIDTMKPAVAERAVAAGAGVVNDVTGLRSEAMRGVVAGTGVAAIAMHMQGTPQTMQLAPTYDDVVAEVRDYFCQTVEACLRSGIGMARLAFDPGIGFGKTPAHNLTLLRQLGALRVAERPLVLGVSRKSFLGKIVGSTEMADRSWPTVTLTSYGYAQGARVFRVHEVAPNVEALRMTEALLAA